MNDFRDLCRARGVPLTWQRQAVLAALLERDDHPTADQIHEAISARRPGMSRTTVYRVLEALVGMGVVARAYHPGAAARFDARTEHHHHLLCTSCSRLQDVPASRVRAVEVDVNLPRGFEPHEYSIYFRGLCPDCAAGRARRDESGKERNP